MRRFSYSLATLTLLLTPFAASAAFITAGELFSSMRTDAAKSFALEIHASSNGAYVSVWASGTEQGQSPESMQLQMKATVDVVQGDMKMRLKGDLLMVDGSLYLKVKSLDGTLTNDVASVSAQMTQLQWVELPLSDLMLGGAVDTAMFGMSSADPDMADSMFSVSSKGGKNGTVYSVSLQPDFAAELALNLQALLHDTEAVSDDFFPWRDLAEDVRFEMTVQTDANDAFLSQNFSISTQSTSSYFNVTGSEKVASSTLKLTAPADALTLDDIGTMFGGEIGNLPDFGSMEMEMPDDMMMPEQPMDMPTDIEGSSFDKIDMGDFGYAPECDDPSLTAVQLFMLQREGTCPTNKATTRYKR